MGMTIAEYAATRGKAKQSVYGQMKRKTNAALLGGHVTKEKRGNLWVQVLDDEAVNILDEASRQSPVVISSADKEELITELRAKVDALTAEVLRQNEQIRGKDEQIEALRADYKLIAEAKSASERRKWHWRLPWRRKDPPRDP